MKLILKVKKLLIGFNRYIVECKFNCSDYGGYKKLVLIDT